MLLKRSMAAVYAPAFSTTTTKGQTFAVQVGNYLSRHRGGVLGQGASVMALALARARESVEPVLRGLEHFREPLELGAGPEASSEHANAERQQDEIDHGSAVDCSQHQVGGGGKGLGLGHGLGVHDVELGAL